MSPGFIPFFPISGITEQSLSSIPTSIEALMKIFTEIISSPVSSFRGTYSRNECIIPTFRDWANT